jgi:3-hydroxy-9,10-secoandrosta-1,3,5(10)-triene-9,17-dione monooxygenase reductase component
MPARRNFDERAYRNALGNFATGVTVVTARDRSGYDVGVTANSFNSVSLDPPLVLWSLDRRTRSFGTFDQAAWFVINVLAADQVALSRRFARRTEGGKFDGVRFTRGRGGAPILAGCAAHFLCRKGYSYDGGDHQILVGEVRAYQDHGRPALMFYRGKYAVPDQAPARPARSGMPATAFMDDYLDYLLTHAAAWIQAQFDDVLRGARMSREEWLVLCTLGDHGAGLTVQALRAVTLLPAAALRRALARMLDRRWVRCGRGGAAAAYTVTRKGHDVLVPLLAAAKAHEADALSHFTDADGRALKQMLKALMQTTRPLTVRRHRARGASRAGRAGRR